jgi:hypothetical protein
MNARALVFALVALILSPAMALAFPGDEPENRTEPHTAHNTTHTPLTTSQQISTIYGISIAVVTIVSLMCLGCLIAVCVAWANRGAMFSSSRRASSRSRH